LFIFEDGLIDPGIARMRRAPPLLSEYDEPYSRVARAQGIDRPASNLLSKKKKPVDLSINGLFL